MDGGKDSGEVDEGSRTIKINMDGGIDGMDSKLRIERKLDGVMDGGMNGMDGGMKRGLDGGNRIREKNGWRNR